jgi:hypothetical protein
MPAACRAEMRAANMPKIKPIEMQSLNQLVAQQMMLVSVDGRLRTVVQPQLVEDIGYVAFYGPLADIKLLCNLSIGKPGGNEAEYL